MLRVLPAPAPNPPAPNRLPETRQRGSRPAAPVAPLRPPAGTERQVSARPARLWAPFPPAPPLRDAPFSSSGAFCCSPPGAGRNGRPGTARRASTKTTDAGTARGPRAGSCSPPGTPLHRPPAATRLSGPLSRGSAPAADAAELGTGGRGAEDALRLRQTSPADLSGAGRVLRLHPGASGPGPAAPSWASRAAEPGSGSGGAAAGSRGVAPGALLTCAFPRFCFAGAF